MGHNSVRVSRQRCECLGLGYRDPDLRVTVPFAFLISTPVEVYGCEIIDVKGEMNLKEEYGAAIANSLDKLMSALCASDRPDCSDEEIIDDITSGHSLIKLMKAEVFEGTDDDREDRALLEQGQLLMRFYAAVIRKSTPMADIFEKFSESRPTETSRRERITA